MSKEHQASRQDAEAQTENDENLKRHSLQSYYIICCGSSIDLNELLGQSSITL